jgi:hypothetical protein
MSVVKKVCLNSSKNYYMGTELSPLHYGLSAEGYDINSIMEGYDKELWIVDVKNNKKVWVKNENLSRITHEEPLIKNILSLYNNTEEIEKINQLKQICGKDGSYNLKDIKKLYNVCDDYDCDNEGNENNEEDCRDCGDCGDCGAGSGAGADDCDTDASVPNNQEKNEGLSITDTNVEDCASSGTKRVAKGAKASKTSKTSKAAKGAKAEKAAKIDNVCDDGNYIGYVDDTLKDDKGAKGMVGTTGTTGTKKENKDEANGDDKKPTDYNIFVKFRLNELKEISTNKKDNFDNVKIEWRELKKNKTELKLVMDKAYTWLNKGR